MTTTLEHQRGMLTWLAAGNTKDAFARSSDERAEVVVPWGIVLRSGSAHRLMGCDGSGNEQQHGLAFARKVVSIKPRFAAFPGGVEMQR